MKFKWKLLVLLLTGVIRASNQSIAGITYMDDFDFEDRYRNVVECDPMYWHPLHLPDRCAKMYEELIRSRLATNYPVRVVKEKNENVIFHMYPDDAAQSHHSKSRHHRHRQDSHTGHRHKQDSHSGSHHEHSSPTLVYRPDVMNSWQSPYERMLDLLRQDVMNHPSGAKIEIIPNLGPVALYRQPISRKSEKAIKKVASAHKLPKSAVASSGDDDYEIIVDKDGKNMLEKVKDKDGNLKLDGGTENRGVKQKRGPKVHRKKIVKDNMIAIYEKKRIT